MPNLHTHIGLAEQVAVRMEHPILETYRGSLLLGATAPDVRAMTKGRREDTHFSSLSALNVLDGVDGLFSAEPQLKHARNLSEPTRAFICGYVSHLVADQSWIISMYRPFFGNSQVYPDVIQGNIMDRALQLELDRWTYQKLEDFVDARSHLLHGEIGVNIGFLTEEVLKDWRDWVVNATERAFSWERLRFMMRRAIPQTDSTEEGIRLVEEFLEHVPLGLEDIYRHVSKERLDTFLDQVVREATHFAVEYLR